MICYRLHVQYSALDVSTSLYIDRYLDNNLLMKDVFIKTINRRQMTDDHNTFWQCNFNLLKSILYFGDCGNREQVMIRQLPPASVKCAAFVM